MALNIKNTEVERLATEIAAKSGETKTEAIRRALLLRQERLALPSFVARWQRIKVELQSEVWPRFPREIGLRGFNPSDRDHSKSRGV